MKENIIREVVDAVRDTAIEFHAHQSLRERLAYAMGPLIDYCKGRATPAAPVVAEGWQAGEPPQDAQFLAYHPSLVHEDFNPIGVVEACFNGEEFIGAVWNGVHDCWDTLTIEIEKWKTIDNPLAANPVAPAVVAEGFDREKLSGMLNRLSLTNRRDGWTTNDPWKDREQIKRAKDAVDKAEAEVIKYVSELAAHPVAGSPADRPIVPHELAYPATTTDAGTAYTNGWNDCRATMLGEVPDDSTNLPVAAPMPASEAASQQADQAHVMPPFAAPASQHEAGLLGEILELASLGISYGLLADDYCGQIAEKIKSAVPEVVAAGGAAAWVSTEDRLPESGVLVMVYSPPTKYDHPGDVNISFDCIDPNDDDSASWLGHNEHYEHFCCVAKPEGSIGPSEKAPYTYWMPLLLPPDEQSSKAGSNDSTTNFAAPAAPTDAKADEHAAVNSHKLGTWFDARTLDEMQAFYLSRLPAIRKAAKEHGYAIGLHGSERRDFDLMAMQWRDVASDKDTLAHAIAVAACGITRDGVFDWEKKPSGRSAVSLPICWADHGNPDFDKPNVGHIDLSLIDTPTAQSVRDAARYRWLRSIGGKTWSINGTAERAVDEFYDEAVDAERALIQSPQPGDA